MEAAPSAAAPGGRVVFVGHTPGPLTFQNPTIHGRELTLIASRNAVRADFDTVFAALRSGAIDPTAWITTRVDPSAYPDAIEGWVRDPGHLVKAILEWPDDASTRTGRPERRVTA
jgi:threonine dehydrogenase-like Zn-dependent dehydrogenase